ncbi:RnfABCDGE type electron transport complex subunit D [Nostoc sp. LEGE 06077]|uniref:RnfABCDGE type electron transport complex subunit D n=1 Tax=Nostoc sp. LEGE 06077 TaxID=915325 RepID=UPI001882DC2A|nr:RnfABCDGE type electron transport complex subunit D [Nostoc sp. LEGE 06077]MBE9206523.1 RnfABCDGE type electron transport complex subunit D [Nostoc sp. LEGE 06077]
MLLKDIRDYQILFLGSFLALGIGTRDWTLRPEMIAVAIASCLSTQWILSLVKRKEQKLNLRSALITALGLSLLLRVDHWATMALAAVSAIASKFFLKVGDKHFFNPANFGIITVLTLTSDAWVSPGQWGEEWWYGLLFAGTGGLILQRVGRWDTTVAFLGSYSLLEAIRNLYLGWTWDVYWHRLMSGSLLLFALFMVTDPRSIPNAKSGRVVWAICIASLTFILRNNFFVSTAVFWALFTLAPLTIVIDWLWSSPRFSWLEAREEDKTQNSAL